MVVVVDHVAFGVTGIGGIDGVVARRALDDVVQRRRCGYADGFQLRRGRDLGRSDTDQRNALATREGQNRVARAVIGDNNIRRGYRRGATIRGQPRHIQLVVGRAIAAVGHVEGLDRVGAGAVGQHNRVAACTQNDVLDLGEAGGVGAVADRACLGICVRQVDRYTGGRGAQIKRVAIRLAGFASGDDVIAEPVCQQERVVTVAAVKRVVAGTAVDGIVAEARHDRVVARARLDAVIVRPVGMVVVVDHVAIGIAGIGGVNGVVARRAFDNVVEHGDIIQSRVR